MNADIGVYGVAAWLDAGAWAPPSALGRVLDSEGKPQGRLLPPMVRRRASVLTRAMIDVLGRCAAHNGCDLERTPMVFGSAWGETGVLMGLLAQMTDGDGALSPVAFASSVHNAASGNASIATGNRGFVTSIAAGCDTPAAALVEALGVLHERGGDVVVVVGDVAAPADLVSERERAASLAVAFHLAIGRPPADALGWLGWPALRDLAPAPWLAEHDAIARHPCAGALAVADVLVRRAPGWVRLDGGRGSGFGVEITFAEGAG